MLYNNSTDGEGTQAIQMQHVLHMALPHDAVEWRACVSYQPGSAIPVAR
jgi:hypothetical protein